MMHESFLHDLIHQAGRLTLEYRDRLDNLAVSYKNSRELVTEADLAVEQFILDQIRSRFPDHAVFGEESGSHAGNEYRWIIDPIDGTASFRYRQPYYSVSIALEHRGRIILGAVYAPVLNEYFFARLGQGATLNGSPISVSPLSQLPDAMLGTGFSCLRAGHTLNNLAVFATVAPQIQSIRRMGSAALDLSYVAAGRMDGFWEFNLNLYDVAAGALILTEAGGRVSDFHNTLDHWPAEVLATNSRLHGPLLELIRRVLDR